MMRTPRRLTRRSPGTRVGDCRSHHAPQTAPCSYTEAARQCMLLPGGGVDAGGAVSGPWPASAYTFTSRPTDPGGGGTRATWPGFEPATLRGYQSPGPAGYRRLFGEHGF